MREVERTAIEGDDGLEVLDVLLELLEVVGVALLGVGAGLGAIEDGGTGDGEVIAFV